MTLTIVLTIVLFVGLLLLFLLMLPRTSPESALLQEVARPSFRYQREEVLRAWRTTFSADLLAKPFTFFRKFFTAEPDPALVRRLLLAGYRKPAHADIFLGARLALPVLFGFSAALIFSSNIIFFFIMAVVLGFFFPDLWLARAIKKRRGDIKVRPAPALGMVGILIGSRPGLGPGEGTNRAGHLVNQPHLRQKQ